MMTESLRWNPVGNVAPSQLKEARLNLHWAAQALLAFADARLVKSDDDSHSNFGWIPESRALRTHEDSLGLSVALRLENLAVMLMTESGGIPHRLFAAGWTLDHLLARLHTALESESNTPVSALALRNYDMPSHPVQDGAELSLEDAGAFQELARWFDNGFGVVTSVTQREPGWSVPRCWPHHFDVGTVLPLGKGPDGRDRFMSVGFSPGDPSYDEPYFYCTAFPSPGNPKISELPVGHWHHDGWFGAVLPASSIVLQSGSAEQVDIVSRWLDASLEAVHTLIVR